MEGREGGNWDDHSRGGSSPEEEAILDEMLSDRRVDKSGTFRARGDKASSVHEVGLDTECQNGKGLDYTRGTHLDFFWNSPEAAGKLQEIPEDEKVYVPERMSACHEGG